MQMAFPVDTYDVIFGIPNHNADITINQLNYMLLQGTYYVYTCRQRDIMPELYNFLLLCKKELNMLHINMIEKGQEERFSKLWAPLHELF